MGKALGSFFKTYWIASRPFSFPASSMPVMLGTMLAVAVGGVQPNWLLFLLALIGMTFLHAGANILNDVCDFEKGLDREVLPVSGAVVRKLLTPRQALKGAIVLFALGSVIGLILAALTTWSIIIIGLIGLASGVLYSATSIGLKYRALGDLTVLLNFGILGCLGAWMVQSAGFSWIPLLWAIPQGLLIAAILHANNWRDIQGDTNGGFKTVAALLGDKGSQVYYEVLIFSPFALLLIYMLLPRIVSFSPALPWTFVVVFLALPLALVLRKKSRQRAGDQPHFEFLTLDGATARLNLAFGLLCVVALILALIYPAYG